MLMLEGNAGIERDVVGAARLLELAAKGRDRDAQYELALLYGTGNGVEKSNAKALEQLRGAAAQGQTKAQYYLASIYRRGLFGVKPDEKLAVDWLRKSALQGYADAEYALGLSYAEGRGVERNAVEALGWMRRAARHEHDQAIEFVRRLESRLKPPRSADRAQGKCGQYGQCAPLSGSAAGSRVALTPTAPTAVVFLNFWC